MLTYKVPKNRDEFFYGDWSEVPEGERVWVGKPDIGEAVKIVQRVGAFFCVFVTKVGQTETRQLLGQYRTEQEAERAARS